MIIMSGEVSPSMVANGNSTGQSSRRRPALIRYNARSGKTDTSVCDSDCKDVCKSTSNGEISPSPFSELTIERTNTTESAQMGDSNAQHSPSKWCCFGCFWRKRNNSETELVDEEPFRKRCFRVFIIFIYFILAAIAFTVTYSMIQDLIKAMNNPVRSIHYFRVKDYTAPGISVYPGGAQFLACGHYYNNVVTSKIRLSMLDLKNRNCTFQNLRYTDPHWNVTRDVLVIRGPTSFTQREAIFLHFALEDETRDFFTVSYYVFPDYDKLLGSEDPYSQLQEYHRYMPTFALSAGLRMWIKLIMSETFLMDNTKHTDFKVEYSVVRFVDRRTKMERRKHLFFIFFEWKNDIIERSYLLYTTTPWSIGAGLCGVFLTLHRGYQLAHTSYARFQKDKARRSIRKRTLRELRTQQSIDHD